MSKLLWTGVYYVFNFEVAVCLFLMAISYLPMIIRRPLKNTMKYLNSPHLSTFMVLMLLFLGICFAESLRQARAHNNHQHPHADFKEKNDHDKKRFRGERNAYLSFGALFLALVISQLWALITRIIELEETEQKQAAKHEALVKQVKNRENQAGLVEVAKGLAEVEKTGHILQSEPERIKALEKTVSELQSENERLRIAARSTSTDKEVSSEVKKRATAAAGAKADKDD